MNVYKIVFFGTPTIAATVLEALNNWKQVEIVLVVTQPDRKTGRKQLINSSPVKEFAIKNQLPLAQPEKIRTLQKVLTSLNADFFITCAYGQFIPESLLVLPKIAPLNLHASLLPKYRGGSPVQYAILNGDSETGISLMKMVKKMDAGPVYAQKKLPIAPEETNGTLFTKLGSLAVEVLKENLFLIGEGKIQAIDQSENQATFAYNFTSNEEKIQWKQANEEIERFVRALSPHPLPYTTLHGQRYKIGKVALKNGTSKGKNGEILEVNSEGILVQTGRGVITILEIQRPGKTMQPAKIYFQNQSLQTNFVGQCFE